MARPFAAVFEIKTRRMRAQRATPLFSPFFPFIYACRRRLPRAMIAARALRRYARHARRYAATPPPLARDFCYFAHFSSPRQRPSAERR